jgi:hypothetical protein
MARGESGLVNPRVFTYFPIPSYLHMDQVHTFASRTCRAAQHDITYNPLMYVKLYTAGRLGDSADVLAALGQLYG